MPDEDRVRIYEGLYLSFGSRGFRDFREAYLPDADGFARALREYDAFYRSIRFTTYRILEFEGEIRHFSVAFEDYIRLSAYRTCIVSWVCWTAAPLFPRVGFWWEQKHSGALSARCWMFLIRHRSIV
jgi:hypothetical protein